VKKLIPFISRAILISLLFFSLVSTAQINILPGPGVTAIDMVENIVGEGIIYDNVQFTGANASRGIFNNGQTTNLGISSGIFLTSGAGYVIPGPNTSSSAGANNGTAGNAVLNSITTSTTYDAAVLEFDFIPESDTLRFKYVFGSEEYNEWVGSSFNDVFGYFVTGPNPMGGQYSNKNIAIVPGTTNTSVKINSVNNGYSMPGVVPTGPCMNCAYYDDNTGGLTLEYDGFTVVMVAWLLVVPCEEYHIMIGIADAGDGIYDSGVFIEENSFTSPKVEVNADPNPVGISDYMIEGCVEADLIFTLPNPEYAPITVCYEITGTATNGVDYELIDNCVSFEEGEDSAIVHIVPLKDGIIEGPETIRLIIENTLGCIVRYDTVEFIILDYVNMITEISPNTMICEGQPVELWVNTFNGIPPYTYDWEGYSNDNDTITVFPDTTTWFLVNVMDMCLDTISDSVKVTVFPTPDVDIGADTAVICEGDSLVLNAGSGFLSYLWQNGSTDSTFIVTEEGFYFVIVAGPGACTNSDSIYVIQSILNIDIGNDTTICIGDSVVFNAGEGYTGYLWQDGSNEPTYVATETGTYWVKVTNDGCSAYDSVYLYVDDPAISMNLGNDTTICQGDEIVLKPAFGVFNSYLWSTGDTTMTITVSEPGTYTLTVESGCGSVSDQITVGNWPYPNPNLGPDLQLCLGGSQTLNAAFGFSEYTWQDNSILPFYSVSQSGVYWCDVTDIHGCVGSDTVYVSVASEVEFEDSLLNLCTGSTLTLDAGFGFDYYTWYKDSTIISSGVQSIEVTTGGVYWVGVNYYFGCPSRDTIIVTEYPVPVASITGNDMICTGESIKLHAPIGNFLYTWYLNDSPISNDTFVEVTQGGNYKLIMENYCGQSVAEKPVQENPLPDPYLGEDITLMPGESITLTVDEGYNSYIWNNNETDTLSNTLIISYENISGNDTTITIKVTDNFNCKNSDEIVIEVFNVKIPNVITPNGDGSNDYFKPGEGWSGINQHKMIVFNRWGEKVWESSDFTSGWDGKQNGKYVAEGSYFWVLEVFYGTDNIKKVYKGSLTVLGTNN
jgi:gliding motility-associated-like protein